MSAVAELAQRTKDALIAYGTTTGALVRTAGGEACGVCFVGGIAAAATGDPANGYSVTGAETETDEPGDLDPIAVELVEKVDAIIPRPDIAPPSAVWRVINWFDGEIKGDLDQAVAVLDTVIEKENMA